MIADENHYKSHWEFFQSTNPKADELFFVELQINEFEKRIKQGLKEIDFANDLINTPEGYENDLNRKSFFFHKEYKEFLESKLVELKNKKDLKHLPQLENSIIVHYGCSDFNSTEHKVYWIGAISHIPNKTYFFESRNEVEVIEKFERYIQGNKDKTFIHWSMNSPKFGFKAIENRYFELTNNNFDFDIKNEIDLSEFLKNKYGINYIDRKNGRLNNLAKLNNFSGIQSDVEVININDATNRLELLFSIVQAEIQGNLKTFQPQPVQETPPPKESETELTETVKKHFNFFSKDCPRKGKQILKDTDFDKLINWTIYYYENDLKIPDINDPIKVINTNMTYVILAFRYLFKEIYPLRTFPNSLFEFFTKAFKPYSEYKKSNFDKAKNDNEVRKLMKIDE
jgi:hypothetical protein